ncbi:helix-turn-helix transcriptional regulator [Nocardioides sp.]|uniref:helix-turn-helix transcriptional regulator n=1 Tax=Nocardioides sp. TaxID=35761 RepID=UPI003D0A0186
MNSEQTSSARTGADLLASAPRRAIVDALRCHGIGEGEVDVGGMTAGQLADALGLHPTTVRFHTDRLEAAGIIRSHLTTMFGVGRPRKVYAVADDEPEDDRTTYLVRLLQLMTESFNTGATPEEAGERWARHHLILTATSPAASPGSWLSKLGPLVDVLQDWGYLPELTTTEGGRTCLITLTDCPFIDLARDNPAVVCGIHEGLVRGALHQLGEDDVAVSVTPFARPNQCDVQIKTHQPFDKHHEESLDESRQPDPTGPDLGSPVLHQDGGQRRPAQPAQEGRPRG